DGAADANRNATADAGVRFSGAVGGECRDDGKRRLCSRRRAVRAAHRTPPLEPERLADSGSVRTRHRARRTQLRRGEGGTCGGSEEVEYLGGGDRHTAGDDTRTTAAQSEGGSGYDHPEGARRGAGATVSQCGATARRRTTTSSRASGGGARRFHRLSSHQVRA